MLKTAAFVKVLPDQTIGVFIQTSPPDYGISVYTDRHPGVFRPDMLINPFMTYFNVPLCTQSTRNLLRTVI